MLPAKLFRGKRRHLRLVADPPLGSSLPRTRGECEGGSRPCPLMTCRHHLAVDVTFAGGARIGWLPEDEPDRPSCTLDVAELDGLTVGEVATVLGISKERVRQIEERALRKIRRGMAKARDGG